ncbi:MAG: hypothetical protein AB7G11_17840 [Phycisphaerales bacterium]
MLQILAQASQSAEQVNPNQIIAVGGAFAVAMLAIVCGTFSGVARNRQREQSRREIAAYVAEGSITPEDGAKLIAAGKGADRCCS